MDPGTMETVAEPDSDIIHVIKPEPDDGVTKTVKSSEISEEVKKEEKVSDNTTVSNKRKAANDDEENDDDDEATEDEETFLLPNCSVQLQRGGKEDEVNGNAARGAKASNRGRGAVKKITTKNKEASEGGRGRGGRGRGQGSAAGRGRGRGAKSAKVAEVSQTSDNSMDVSDENVSVKVEPGDEEDSLGPPREPLAPQTDQITLLPSVNSSHAPELRTLFMGQTDIGRAPGEPPVELWLNLVAKRLGDEKKMVYQCYFCPETRDIPKTISDHMQADHEDLRFAVSRNKRVGLSKVTYFLCRNCDFVAPEAVIMWIHYEAYHGLTGILDSGSNCMVKPDMDDEFNSIADESMAEFALAFVCLDCKAVSDDKKKIANHIVRDHGAVTEHFNGYFVKTMQVELILEKTVDKKPSTYREAAELPEFASLRKECYICFVCGFVASGAYLAISHYISNHHHLRLLQICTSPALGQVTPNEDCCRQYVTEQEFAEHMSLDHGEDGISARILCSSTLVGPPSVADEHGSETRIPGDGLAGLIECVVENRSAAKMMNGVAVAVAEPVNAE